MSRNFPNFLGNKFDRTTTYNCGFRGDEIKVGPIAAVLGPVVVVGSTILNRYLLPFIFFRRIDLDELLGVRGNDKGQIASIGPIVVFHT